MPGLLGGRAAGGLAARGRAARGRRLDAATEPDLGFPATFIRDTGPWVFGAAAINLSASARGGVARLPTEMPPIPTWFAGREQIGRFLAAHVIRKPDDFRTVLTGANGQPALS